MTFDSALPHSALYHGGNGGASFNSSGRSSNCDDGDMQSDISLEEDVNDLNQKVRQIFVTFGVIHLLCIQPWRRETLTFVKNSLMHGVNNIFCL